MEKQEEPDSWAQKLDPAAPTFVHLRFQSTKVVGSKRRRRVAVWRAVHDRHRHAVRQPEWLGVPAF